jgi:hypothetical protein
MPYRKIEPNEPGTEKAMPIGTRVRLTSGKWNGKEGIIQAIYCTNAKNVFDYDVRLDLESFLGEGRSIITRRSGFHIKALGGPVRNTEIERRQRAMDREVMEQLERDAREDMERRMRREIQRDMELRLRVELQQSMEQTMRVEMEHKVRQEMKEKQEARRKQANKPSMRKVIIPKE